MTNRVDLKQIAQPYVGRTEDYTKAIFPRATTAELADPTALVNLVGKYNGRMVYDTTLGQPVWAVGSAATAFWIDGAGTDVHTPGVVYDPYWANVGSLMLFEGVDGATTGTTDDDLAQTQTFGTGASISDAVGGAVVGSTTALKLSGATTAAITVPHNAAHWLGGVNSEFTIEFFFYLNSAPAQPVNWMGKWASPNKEWNIRKDAGESHHYHYGSSDGTTDDMIAARTVDLWPPPVDAAWHHYAWTRDNDTNRMWIDGQQEAAWTYGGAFYGGTALLTIGALAGVASLDAYIDQFRLTPGILRYPWAEAGITVPTDIFPTQ